MVMNIINTIYTLVKEAGHRPRDYSEVFEQIKEHQRIESHLREYINDCVKWSTTPKLYRLNKILRPEFK
jgi:uncharacterized protein YutE (UPF0331/DUF86 family)